MGKRGPRPEPAALKIAKGTFKGASVNEPVGEKITTLPPPPDSLGVEGRKRWAQIGEQVIALGYLESRHLTALERFAACYDELQFCEDAIAKDGRYVETATGFIGSHPAVKDAKTVTDAIRKWHFDFGLTPTSGAGIKVTAKGDMGVMTRKRG